MELSVLRARRWGVILLLSGLVYGLVTLPAPATSWAQGESRTFKSYEWLLITEEKFDQPIFVTHAGDGSNRLFVVEQGGAIWIVNDGIWNATPFLDLSNKLPEELFRGGYTERGLLGLAFHPRYRENGVFFVSYTRKDKQNILARFTVRSDDPNRADPASEQVLIAFTHPEMNHNGGMLAFGPDGYLYMSVGDGGGTQGDPDGNAQNKSSWLGKILRLNVDQSPYQIPADNPFVSDPAARPEIWAYGLRNAWRFSFDRGTGDLYVGDVGWGNWEEINVLRKGQGGANFGWNVYEANILLDGKTDPGGLTDPVAVYPHQDGACSVAGGYVVRGPSAPSLAGVYLYGDYCVGRIWALWRDSVAAWQSQVLMETGMQISSFGEDQDGRIYLVNYKGYIYRLRER